MASNMTISACSRYAFAMCAASMLVACSLPLSPFALPFDSAQGRLAQGDAAQGEMASRPSSGGSGYIKHIVLIVQENRSFDDFFATFPGADGATTGRWKKRRSRCAK